MKPGALPLSIRRKLLAAFLLFLLPGLLCGQAASVKEYGYTLDLPEGWVPVEASDPAKLAFADATRTCFIQSAIIAHEPDLSAAVMGKDIGVQLNARGEGRAFVFSGRDAYFSELGFSSNKKPFRGYVLVVKGLDRGPSSAVTKDAIIIAFAPEPAFPQTQDALLSALDSFSPDAAGKLLPGPISQLTLPFPSAVREPVSLPFEGGTLEAAAGKGERQIAQALVEREARLLASYTTGQIDAWRRFYRMIYRDSYHRLDGILESLRGELVMRSVPSSDAPLHLLSWIQGFSFKRTGTLSDFFSPIATLEDETGDCDSRALLYSMLLNHLGIDAIVLVSTRYNHALAAVAIDHPGAAFTFEGKKYVVAEMTKPQELGLIAKDMSDGSAWIPMRLTE